MVTDKIFRLMDGERGCAYFTRDEIRAAYRQGEEAAIQLFEYLMWELQALQDRARTKTVKTVAIHLPAMGSKSLAPGARRLPGNKKNGG